MSFFGPNLADLHCLATKQLPSLPAPLPSFSIYKRNHNLKVMIFFPEKLKIHSIIALNRYSANKCQFRGLKLSCLLHMMPKVLDNGNF